MLYVGRQLYGVAGCQLQGCELMGLELFNKSPCLTTQIPPEEVLHSLSYSMVIRSYKYFLPQS